METSATIRSDDEEYGEMPVLIPEQDIDYTTTTGMCSNAASRAPLHPRKSTAPRPQLKVTPIPAECNVPNKTVNKQADLHVNFSRSPPDRVTFSMNLSSKTEEQENGKELKFRCAKCPAKFRDVTNADEHLKRHGRPTGSRFECRYCDYSASLENSINRHEKLHRVNPGKDAASTSPVTENLRKRVSTPFNIRISDMKRKKLLKSDETSSSCSFNSGNSNDLSLRVNSSSRRNAEEEPTRIVTTTATVFPEVRAQTTTQAGQSSSRFDDTPPKLDFRNLQRDSSVPKKCSIKSLRVTNFMCFREQQIDIDASNIIRLEGEQKSARIIAFVIGLGLDLMRTRLDLPQDACGMTLTSQNIVARGSLTSTVEIVLALHSVPVLEQKYGSHLSLKRHISSRLPLEKSVFAIRSVDPGHQFSTVPKFVHVSYVLNILEILDIMPFANLMLLDEDTLQEVQKETGKWYKYYSDAVKLKKRDLLQRIIIIQLKQERIEGEMRYKEMKLAFLKSQLAQEYPSSDSSFESLRVTDVKSVRKLEAKLRTLTSCLNEHQNVSSDLQNEFLDLESVYSKRMCDTFRKFLEAQAFTGNVIIDHTTRRLAIWVSSLRDSEVVPVPTTVEEAESMWEKTVNGRQRMGAMGIFFAFWSIIENCPFFAVDAFSNNEVDFHVPSRGLQVLMDLIKNKENSTMQQFCLSVPNGV